jgi:hypothetical protein
MKRCPKCEFIYEDDQSLCDMDGALLVLDSRNLPNLHALQTVRGLKTSPKRNRAVPAFATLILALVLGMVYYVSTEGQPTEDDLIPAQPTTASMWHPMPRMIPAEQPKPELPRSTAAAASAAVPVRKAPAKPALTATKAKADEKTDDSKVGNLLKKTGRLLKKPFKL